MRSVTLTVLALFAIGCNRGKEGAVTIVPREIEIDTEAVPRDPFGSSSAAYERLREVTDAALSAPWKGDLRSFAPWLEEQTVAVERSLHLLKALRAGPHDVYAVASGRIAMVYDQIAEGLTQASRLAEAEGFDADWKGQQSRVWEQAVAFWERCARGCGAGGTHLDAWELRCRAGLARSKVELARDLPPESPRQPK
jgi:hypothetical protein